MRSMLALLSLLLATLAISGCSSAPVREIGLDKPPPRKAEQELSTGIRNYEDGNYKNAARSLQTALDTGLTFKNDQIAAHKYLAFIHCAQEREKQCRDEFRTALELDPKFELSTAEAGHPVWGPVFRSVKSELPLSRSRVPAK
jgi:Tfp pilus assembly protein PilF